MSELPKLSELVTKLLQEKRHPIELYGPSVHKHNKSEPVEYFPARNSQIVEGLSWYHGLAVDLSLANVHITADYSCGEVNVYSGWLAAIDKAVREQVFGDRLFYFDLRHEYKGEGIVQLKFSFDGEVPGIVGRGNFSLGLRDLFPRDSSEDQQVMAALNYQSLSRQAQHTVVSQAEVDAARSKFEALVT